MTPERFDVLVVGAGFSGLGMGIRLRQEGRRSFLVIEKSDDIGGTWYDNRYPGCACDIPSHLYSFSFDLNPEWSRMYSSQQEIFGYLKQCAARYGIVPHIRLNTRLKEAAWDESAKLWRATLGDGSVVESRALVSGVGALHIPRYPEIPGIERFAGPSFHSASWRHDVDLDGKSVAVIGTGASAIQFVPHVAERAGRLYLFQRTPPWILPRMDFAITERWRDRFRRSQLAMRLFRELIFLRHEMFVFAFLGNRFLRGLMTRMAQKHLEAQVSDPKLRAALTPRYEIGCKRILASNDFYPAVCRPSVELVTDAISELREHSVVTADGRERPVDVVIYGTGFRVTDPFCFTQIMGRNGVDLRDAWQTRMSAFLGVTVTGFPNFFLLLGPNTGLGHNSVVLMIEAQIRYVMSCLELMDHTGSTVMEVSPDAQQRFLQQVSERLSHTVWQSGGCRSWYQDQKTGDNPVIWPGSVVEYVWRTRRASASDYEFN